MDSRKLAYCMVPALSFRRKQTRFTFPKSNEKNVLDFRARLYLAEYAYSFMHASQLTFSHASLYRLRSPAPLTASISLSSKMNFLDLPQELILRVFQNLSLSDSRTLIQRLHTYNDPKAHKVIKLLWITCCSDKVIISFPNTETPLNEPFEFVSSVDVYDTIKAHVQYGVVPKHLQLFFSRNPRDYTRFQNHLLEVWELLDSNTVVKYLHAVQELDFELRGNLITTESPTLLVSLILNTFVKLTSLKHANWKTIRILLTDLGDYFPQKWGRVFEEFRLTQELVLDDNLIRLLHPLESYSLLEGYFKWPSQLRVLSLRRNLISNFSATAIKLLPNTLEVLDLENNVLEQFGTQGTLKLTDELPHLRLLNLSNNRGLVKFEPTLLIDWHQLTTGLTVKIENCNIYAPILASITRIAKEEGIVLMV